MIQKVLLLMLSVSLTNAQTTESFNVLLKNLARIYTDEEENDAVLRWEGVKTWQGFDLVTGKLLENVGGNSRSNSFYILKRMQLPPNEMVDRLLAGAKIALNEPESLPPHLSILVTFPQDDRIIKWLAGLLNDQRLVPDPQKKRGEDRSGGQTARVCDCASGAITRMLIARKQIPSEGLGVGDPSLEYNYSGRDRYKSALVKKLNELGFYVKEPTSKPAETSNLRPEKPRGDVKAEVSIDREKNSLAVETSNIDLGKNKPWIRWVTVSIIFLSLVFFLLRKMRRSQLR